ncbi:type II secretion system F family protein [Pleionea sp. CnH1-48]|uniref:type II secretion system F family protein n=1 Tax=Pleionea sp. CnH1-48 TaxID=2954494 RepID=UPI002096D76D|nr:type II secretion system F family protein [Pleionea sp. CnH1-48]MCO7226307.1 type II secretion system F family protein [Pleionea sp. CnH1-48]
MPFFQYKARNASGEAVTGTYDTTSREALAERLISQQLIPVEIKEVAERAEIFDLSLAFKAFRNRTLKTEDLVMFSRQMYSLIKAGVPLNRALNGIIESTHNPLLKETLRDIVDSLTAGNDLATSLSQHPKIFNSLYVSLIHVGENSGQLEEAFRQVAHYLETEEVNRNRIKSATRYPIIVVIVLLVAFSFITVYVIPQLSALFKHLKGDELPIFTRILIGTSDFVVNYWFVIILVVVAIALGIYSYIQTDNGRLFWDEKKLKTPVFGSIIYRSLLIRFSRSFAMMSRAGVAVTNTLGVVAHVVDNKFVGNRILDMKNGVERGENITTTARRSEMFSPLVMQMLAVGEDTGQVDDMLDEVADFYEREVDYDLKKLSDYIEPFLILLVGGMVTVLALGVFMPVWELAGGR